MIIADAHLHIYPCYDVGLAFRKLIDNLNACSSTALKAAFLAERSECHFFPDLRGGRIPVPDGFSVEETGEGTSLRIMQDGRFAFYLLAGRQVATAERLEVLALTSDQIIDDGTSAADVIEQAGDEGGIPVLTWALGKWTLKRKRIVKQLIDTFGPQRLILGDSSLRPSLLPEPGLFGYAAAKGFTILAGSDPLPSRGDERFMGRYATLIGGDVDDVTPASSVRELLKLGPEGISICGRRGSIMEVLRRQMKL